MLQSGKIDRFVHHINNFLRYVSSGLGVLDILEDNGKFIATKPCHGIALTNATREPFGNFLEKQIAKLMTLGVIDDFEIIKFDEQQCQGLVIAPASNQCLLEPAPEQTSIGKACQLIKLGKVRQSLF